MLNNKKLINYLIVRENNVNSYLKNFDIIKKMCENSGMTNEQINERMKKAKMSGDYILLGLLCAA